MGLAFWSVNSMHLKALTLLVVFTASALADQYSFESYQINFGKEYSSPKEYVQRKAIFESNVNEILKHNKMKGVSYTKGINKFTDMTQKEIESQIEGFPSVPKNIQRDISTEMSLKALKAKYTNYQFEDLAEQYLVDCAYDYSTDDGFDAQGCAGAWPQAYMEYLVKESKGQHQMEANYPYTAQDGTCSAQADGYYKGATMTDSISYWGSNEEELKALLVEHGPVVTGVDASGLSYYNGGIYDDYMCCEAASDDSCVNGNNHAVLVVGYGPGYFLVKNSWGSRWGEDGFFKIKSDVGLCGFGWQLNSVPLC